jgi:hypothetical protein
MRPKTKPLIDWTDDEIKTRLREMYKPGNYAQAPNDYYRELERRTAARHARISAIASVVSAIVATAAVILSAIAIAQR